MKKLCWLLLFFSMMIGAKLHAQTGPTPCGTPSYFTTWNPLTSYITGNVAIRYGVTFQSIDANTGWDPCTSPQHWTTTIGTSSGATLGQNTFTGAQLAPSVNGVLNATLFSGSDIGTQIPNAIASLPVDTFGNKFGTITLPAKLTYTYSTTIHIPPGVELDCQGSALVYTGGTKAAIAIYTNTPPSSNSVQYNLAKVTHCAIVQSGKTATGIYLGGDPSNSISPSTAYGSGVKLEDVSTNGFQYGLGYGNNTYLLQCLRCWFGNGFDGVFVTGSAIGDSGETLDFIDSLMYNNTHCGYELNNNTQEVRVHGGSADYNSLAQVCGGSINFESWGTHFESYNGPLIFGDGTPFLERIIIHGGNMVYTQISLSAETSVQVSGANVLTITAPASTTVGWKAGQSVFFSNFVGASFLNGTNSFISAISTISGVTTITIPYTSSAYGPAADTGTVQPSDTVPAYIQATATGHVLAKLEDVEFTSNYLKVPYFTSLPAAATNLDSKACVISQFFGGNQSTFINSDNVTANDCVQSGSLTFQAGVSQVQNHVDTVAPSGACGTGTVYASGASWTNTTGSTLATIRYTCVVNAWIGG